MKITQLQDFCDFVQGGRHKLSGKNFVDEGYPSFGAGGLNGFLPEPEFDRDGVVLSAIGARCGKCFLAEGKWSSLANTQVIFPDPRKADVRFLWYQLNDEQRWPRHGLAQPFIRPSDVKTHKVYLPPINEQRRIAAILDKADALRRKRNRALELLGEVSNSALETHVDHLARGKSQHLGQSLEFITTGGRNWSKYYAEEGTRFIRSLDVQMNSISDKEPIFVNAPDNAEARRTRTQAGDVLLTVTGSRIGRVAALPNELSGSYVSQHVAILRPNPTRLRRKFLSYFLSSKGGQKQISKWQYGQTKPGLNFTQIEGFEIPDIGLEQQSRIEILLESFEAAASAQQSQQMKLETLFSSLQHRAFSGQL